jgi:trehalose utilization protein
MSESIVLRGRRAERGASSAANLLLLNVERMPSPIRVTVWNEFIHERKSDVVKGIYPDGIHAVVAAALVEQLGDRVEVRTATLEEPEHGLTKEVLKETDVLMWWGTRGA